LGQRRDWKNQKLWAGKDVFLFILKTASTTSSSTAALVAAGSLQPWRSGLRKN